MSSSRTTVTREIQIMVALIERIRKKLIQEEEEENNSKLGYLLFLSALSVNCC